MWWSSCQVWHEHNPGFICTLYCLRGHPSGSVESFCYKTVLTLCQSGRWNTPGGRGRLNPCELCHHALKRRKCSVQGRLLLPASSFPGSVLSFCSTAFMRYYLSLHRFSLSLYSASKVCLHLLPVPLLYHTISSTHCPCVCIPVTHSSHQQPLAAFEVLTVVTGSCVWQGSPSKSRPSRTPSHTIWMAIPQKVELATDWLPSKPMRDMATGAGGYMERMTLTCFSYEKNPNM